MSTNHSDFVASLQSQIDSLQIRVKELEAENAKLLSQLTDRSNHEIEKKLHCSDDKHMKSKNGNTKTEEKIQKMPGYHSMLIKHSKRYVALTVMYFGKRFYGFSSEGQMDPTVESEIFKALEKTRLLVGDKKESQYSRCGRTDKGVSSVGQVIALFLRSNLKVSGTNNRNAGEIFSEEPHEGEIDYVKVLNRVLPNDIRILGWCPVPVDFHARFSCLSREYKYFFWSENLNIQEMESAAKKFLGEHDFRNFCKMDAANVHNYRRQITLFELSPTNVRYDDNQLWVIKINGTAFLWHQVRCMVAVLFMVGKGHESPDVIEILLDTNRTPRKPQYIMAAEVPLVLQSCEFEDIRFMCSSDAGEALRLHLVNECQTYQLQAAIFHEAILNCVSPSDGAIKTCSIMEEPRRKLPMSLFCHDQLSHHMRSGAPNSTQHEDSTYHYFISAKPSDRSTSDALCCVKQDIQVGSQCNHIIGGIYNEQDAVYVIQKESKQAQDSLHDSKGPMLEQSFLYLVFYGLYKQLCTYFLIKFVFCFWCKEALFCWCIFFE